MASAECERAIEDAIRYGYALVRHISPNDVGVTGSHMYGYYLPKHNDVWPLFTPHPPTKNSNDSHPIRITWQNGRVTESNVKWYGVGTRSEYRITGFGRKFPYISHGVVGNLLVLIPTEKQKSFRGYVLDTEADFEEISAQLAFDPVRDWTLYVHGVEQIETEDECAEREFCEFAKGLEEFPTGEQFSERTWQLLQTCVSQFETWPVDRALVKCMATEFSMFKFVERQLCRAELLRPFASVDDFIATAQTLLQRRKSRAGRSLENHVEHYFKRAGIPHKMRPKISGKPDIIVPGEAEYADPEFPVDKLFVIAVKTTCKDRWPQVLKEGNRIKKKHLLTFQKGMAITQLQEMASANVQLVVPESLHKLYPPRAKSGVEILTFQELIYAVMKALH